MAAGVVPAQSGEWEFLGLGEEWVKAVTVSPSNPSTIYVGTGSDFTRIHGKIFKSEDAGNTWDTLAVGVDVREIVIDPQDPQNQYAALGFAYFDRPGVLKSTDEGETWYWADSGIRLDGVTNVGTIIIDPLHPDTLYAGTGGLFGGSVYKSVDGGLSWEDIGRDISGESMTALAIEYNDKDTAVVYVGTTWLGNVYKSVGGTQDWMLTGLRNVGSVRSLAFDVNEASLLYAGAEDPSKGYAYVVYRSADAGTSWTVLGTGLPGSLIHDIVFRPGRPGEIYVSTYDGVYRSLDSGSNWEAMNDGLENTRINDLFLTASGETLFCGTEEGLYRVALGGLGVGNGGQEAIPVSFELKQNYPNPFNKQTTVWFSVPTSEYLELAIFDLQGRKVLTIVEGERVKGTYSMNWNGTNNQGHPVPSGIYILRLLSENSMISKKMVLVR